MLTRFRWLGYLQLSYMYTDRAQHLTTAAWDPDGPDDDPDRGNPLSRAWKQVVHRPQSTFRRFMARGPPRAFILFLFLYLYFFLCQALNQARRSQDLMMSQIENQPGGFNALRRLYTVRCCAIQQ